MSAKRGSGRERFFELLESEFFPRLIEEGFVRQGRAFRRIRTPLIHVVECRPDSSGEWCYLEMGAHLAFLPQQGGGEFSSATIDEPGCVFRERLAGDGEIAGGGWAYGASEEESFASARSLGSAWESAGSRFFAAHQNFPDDYQAMLDKTDLEQVRAIELLTFARIAANLQQKEQALALAHLGLERAAPAASSLRAQLRRFIESEG
ncbi:DUF4304 domain-containing protein [Stenotrophomonas maltophilia]|uniref:DUF4304 domain-containing protein n=1 Tax=Stenotrophomonas maltophilia TaxID=40324 RepID=A0A6B8J9B9_STEMA|nr:DUF4304 domain-containing protein [Stenotrophomonas maltophilia]MBH1651470.1 DUF4304 domain-containing protein [Stenotrophomonas maltophilia]QGM01896.1 DUF4304 domain-containing protein [Stenotrophomonas maltophilia]HDS1511681.1 DUF4304 domain-containing protein [Stenotrophomonas maltophilia]